MNSDFFLPNKCKTAEHNTYNVALLLSFWLSGDSQR